MDLAALTRWIDGIREESFAAWYAETRLVFADWLEDQGDRRADAVRRLRTVSWGRLRPGPYHSYRPGVPGGDPQHSASGCCEMSVWSRPLASYAWVELWRATHHLGGTLPTYFRPQLDVGGEERLLMAEELPAGCWLDVEVVGVRTEQVRIGDVARYTMLVVRQMFPEVVGWPGLLSAMRHGDNLPFPAEVRAGSGAG